MDKSPFLQNIGLTDKMGSIGAFLPGKTSSNSFNQETIERAAKLLTLPQIFYNFINMNRDEAMRSYIVCSNFGEVQLAANHLRQLGFHLGFNLEEYNSWFCIGVNQRGSIFSFHTREEQNQISGPLRGYKRVSFKDLFKPKSPLNPEIVSTTVSFFLSRRAFNEDSALSFKDIDTSGKTDIGTCYDLMALNVLGEYKGKFFLRNKDYNVNQNIEITPNVKKAASSDNQAKLSENVNDKTNNNKGLGCWYEDEWEDAAYKKY